MREWSVASDPWSVWELGELPYRGSDSPVCSNARLNADS